MQQLINFHAWESEQLLRLMYQKSKETGVNIETFTVIIDASGWTIGQATRDAFTFIKGLSRSNQDELLSSLRFGIQYQHGQIVNCEVRRKMLTLYGP